MFSKSFLAYDDMGSAWIELLAYFIQETKQELTYNNHGP